MLKRTLFLILIVLAIFVVGGFGGVYFDRYLVPKLQSWAWLANTDFFKKATEHTTIINTTQQVVIREDDTVERIVSQPATAVVNIIAQPSSAAPVQGNAASLGAAASGLETRTGILITNDGLIVTYSEVKPDSSRHYSVLLFDGSSHNANFVGQDPLTNLAFFRISDQVNTPAIALANSDDTRVGRRLIAIGNSSVEYQNRLALGILQNKNRIFNLSGKTVSSSEKWEGVFEMDIARSADFVGGPVIDYNGEMTGLVATLTIDNATRAFLLPSNVVRDSMNHAINNSLGNRPALGVYYLPITKALSLGWNLSRDRGALIYSPSGQTGLAILANSVGAHAGLQVGDIITAVNGQEINLDNPLPDVLARYNKGDTIELLIERAGQEIKINVVL